MQRLVATLTSVVPLLVAACRDQHAEPPAGDPPRPPRSSATLTPEAGVTAPPAGLHQRLFADDVDLTTLPLSVAIETMGNISMIIVPRGTRLPVSRTEVFSTGIDDQPTVEVHILQGERPLVTDNRSVGKFQMMNIPPAPRGVPQIEVTFNIDQLGVLSVSARDKVTGDKPIRVTGPLAGPLDKAKLEQILAETAAKQPFDEMAREWSAARTQLETMIYSSRQLFDTSSHKLKRATRTRFQREIKAAEAILGLSTKPENPALLRGVTESLRKVAHAASEELYKP